MQAILGIELDADVSPPTRTPWGEIQTSEQLLPGIWVVSTAGHGGMWLSPARVQQLPLWVTEFRSGSSALTWYEEDCEFSIGVLAFASEFEGLKRTQGAGEFDLVASCRNTLRHTFPEMHERMTGRLLKPGESRSRDNETFRSRHRNDFLTVSACGSWHAKVPEGKVLVSGLRQLDKRRASFLVPESEYQVRSNDFDKDLLPEACEFIVGLTHHIECDADGVPLRAGVAPTAA